MGPAADKNGRDPFRFRGLHPMITLGTASDRYAGWQGQIYSPDKYLDRVTQRTKKVGATTFTEKVLPVDSVAEYFEHFGILEIDFTFYRPLLAEDRQPTTAYHVLQQYSRHLKPDDRLLLKVPQQVLANKLYRAGGFVANPDYLDADLFAQRFYESAQALIGDRLAGFVFEQAYQRKNERLPVAEIVAALKAFFSRLPTDDRYHLELRTPAYLKAPYFDLLAEMGVGQVLSHWTWLPALSRQFKLAGRRFFNAGRQTVIRLITPLHLSYEETYGRAFPFDVLVEGMASPAMIPDTLDLIQSALARGQQVNVIVNNRSGGNAPLIAREVARGFAQRQATPAA